ncbi:hypothetical protein DFJ74DRAFT_681314 [Hyaloraphidium curvatum]|nr:hypothetical protein DFJ74DRAFT_681314 [Hyaloraphidium curvatum]
MVRDSQMAVPSQDATALGPLGEATTASEKRELRSSADGGHDGGVAGPEVPSTSSLSPGARPSTAPGLPLDGDIELEEREKRVERLLESTSFFQTVLLGSAAGFVAEFVLFWIEGGGSKHGWKMKPISEDLKLVATRKAPATGLLVASYEVVRQGLRNAGLVPSGAGSPMDYLLHGAAAATIAQLLETSIWAPISNTQLARDRLLATGAPAPSVSRLLLQTLFREGPRPLYRGAVTSFAATFPTISLYYGISDALVVRAKQKEEERGGKDLSGELPLLQLAGIGAASSFMAVLLATPIEFVRARLVDWRHAPAGTSITDVITNASRSSARKAVFSLFRNSVRQAVTKGGRRNLARVLARGFSRSILRNPAALRRTLSSAFGRLARTIITRGRSR